MVMSTSPSFIDEVYSTFQASVRSVGTACTLAAVGIYLHRSGFIVGDGKRTMALISQQVTIPLLFFTKIIYCNQDWSNNPCPDVMKSLADVWVLLIWPAYVVFVGFAVGYFCAWISNTPRHQFRAVLVACGFGNSTGLPITLLTVVHTNFPSDTDLGRIDPCLFLSVYLLLYPVLQWGIGGWLLAPDEDAEDDEDEELALGDEPKFGVPQLSEIIHSTRSRKGHSTLARNVLNVPLSAAYRQSHRGMAETDASLYMSVQDDLYRMGYSYDEQQQQLTYQGTPKPETQDIPVNTMVKTDSNHDIGMDLSPDNSVADAAETTPTFPEQAVVSAPQNEEPAPTSEKTALLSSSPAKGEADSVASDDADMWETISQVTSRCLQPPVVGALLGMIVASQPWLRGIFVDLVSRNGSAPLEWAFDGLHSVGLAAVPINMMILGCNLSASFPSREALSRRTSDSAEDEKKLFSLKTTVAIVIGKMLIMPIVGFLSAWVCKETLWTDMPQEISASFYLVILIVFITPTANNVMVMVELSGSGSKAGIARLIAWQYVVAPILLSVTMTASVGIALRWS